MNLKRSDGLINSGVYQAAVEQALHELASARAEADRARHAVQEAETRINQLERLLQELLNHLPKGEAEKYIGEIPYSAQPERDFSRRSHVYNNVISLFQEENKLEWTSQEIKERLQEKYKITSSKPIYNVLNYLERKGKLKRISRGHYRIEDIGAGVITSDNFHGSEDDTGQ